MFPPKQFSVQRVNITQASSRVTTSYGPRIPSIRWSSDMSECGGWWSISTYWGLEKMISTLGHVSLAVIAATAICMYTNIQLSHCYMFLQMTYRTYTKWRITPYCSSTLLWRHNGRGSVPNHQPHDCLLNRWITRRSKKTSRLRVTGLWAGNSPGTGEFPAEMASNAKKVSLWWRHHE